MTRLHLAAGLELPVDVVTQKLAFLGRTGSGKTYGATKLAELMLGHDAQLIALDPVGVWYGLRVGADFRIPVFGGLHGDIPLEPTAGGVLADLVVDRGISAVLDVSQFETDAQKARFAEAFASRFFFRKKAAPSAVHVFLEECQEFVPQNPQGGDAQMLHAFTRLAKLGRNFGIGLSLISQRPQEINKKVLNMTEVMFAFQMRGPQERKTIKDWSSDKDLEVDIVAELPGLAVGEAFVSSPQWLQVEKKVRIAKKVTADVSSTPKVGAAAKTARELTPIDLEQLRSTMAATIEKAKAEDPKELQREIARLRGELTKTQKGTPAPDPAMLQQRIDAAVAAAMRAEWKRAREALQLLKALGGNLDAIEKAASNIRQHVDGVRGYLEKDEPPAPSDRAVSHAPRVAVVAGPRAAAPAAAPVRSSPRAVDSSLSRTCQRILDAIAFYESVGVPHPTKAAVAAFVGVSPRSGSWTNRLSDLRVPGYIADAGRDAIALTDAGRALADTTNVPTSLEQLHGQWMAKVNGTAGRMLRVLLDVYPDSIEKTALAAHVGVSHESGSYTNRLSELRVPGLLVDVSRSEVRASDTLFPQGLT